MHRQLTLCICLVLLALFLQRADGYSVWLFKENINYTINDILENTTANSLLQCARRSSTLSTSAAIEWQKENSTCVILKSATKISVASGKEQYLTKHCSDGWFGFFDSCYFMTPKYHNWTECNVICSTYGGHLATDTSEKESNVMTLLRHAKHAWIGGTKTIVANGEDIFAWSNGEQWEYTNWAIGQPKKQYDSCIRYMGINVGWYDYDCAANQRCICEIE